MKNGRKIRFLQWAYVSSSCSMYWKCQQRLLMSVSLSHVWLINLWSSTTVEMSLFLHEIISLSHSLPVNLFLFIYFETGTLPCSFELLFSLHCLTTFSNTFAHWCICVCFWITYIFLHIDVIAFYLQDSVNLERVDYKHWFVWCFILCFWIW